LPGSEGKKTSFPLPTKIKWQTLRSVEQTKQKFVLTKVGLAARIHKARVARWFIFFPNILIWVNFGGPLNGKCLNIL
jgi:hypothetical protein